MGKSWNTEIVEAGRRMVKIYFEITQTVTNKERGRNNKQRQRKNGQESPLKLDFSSQMIHEAGRKSFVLYCETRFAVHTQTTFIACLDFTFHLLPICHRYWFANIRIVCTYFSCLDCLYRLSQICNPKHSYLCGFSQANFEIVWIIVMSVTQSFLWETIVTDVKIVLSSPTPPHFSSFAPQILVYNFMLGKTRIQQTIFVNNSNLNYQ